MRINRERSIIAITFLVLMSYAYYKSVSTAQVKIAPKQLMKLLDVSTRPVEPKPDADGPIVEIPKDPQFPRDVAMAKKLKELRNNKDYANAEDAYVKIILKYSPLLAEEGINETVVTLKRHLDHVYEDNVPPSQASIRP